MNIIISIILLLIFIVPATAQEKSDVTPNYSQEQIQDLLNTIREGIECDLANDSLKADLTYYNAINTVLNIPESEVLTKINDKIEKNNVLFEAFVTGLVQALISTEKYTDEEIRTILQDWTAVSNSKIDMRKSIGYKDGMLEQHLVATFKYLNKCRKWEKDIMGTMAPN